MIVCVCKRVSDRDIARSVHAGQGFDDIQRELGVSTQCGRCEGCARDLVARCRVALHSPCAPQTRAPMETPVWTTPSPSPLWAAA